MFTSKNPFSTNFFLRMNMNHSFLRSIAVMSTASILTIGCGKKNDTDQAAQNANNAANAVSQAMGTAQGTAAHKSSAHSIPSTTLSGLLPNPSGYTAHDPSTSSANFNGIEWSIASREFDNGTKHLKVTLADYNYAEGLTAAYSMLANFSTEDENELQHGEKFGSNPGWVTWHKKSNEGEIGVIVGDRVYLIVEGSGGVTLDDLRAVVGQVNLDNVAKAAS